MSTSPCARVTHRFSAPAEAVYAAWLDPDKLGRWMFGPDVRDEVIVRLQLDARVGGRFSFVGRRGETELDHQGEYLELDTPSRLAFTWGVVGSDSSRVSIDIVPLDHGCELTLIHELHPNWADFADRAAGSWSRMLEALDRMMKLEELRREVQVGIEAVDRGDTVDGEQFFAKLADEFSLDLEA